MNVRRQLLCRVHARLRPGMCPTHQNLWGFIALTLPYDMRCEKIPDSRRETLHMVLYSHVVNFMLRLLTFGSWMGSRFWGCVISIQRTKGSLHVFMFCEPMYGRRFARLFCVFASDINECEGDHGCDQNCVNMDGSYTCSCNTGYTIDGFRCHGMSVFYYLFKYSRTRCIKQDMVYNHSLCLCLCLHSR